MKKFLDQDFSGAALLEFKREVSIDLAFYVLICNNFSLFSISV